MQKTTLTTAVATALTLGTVATTAQAGGVKYQDGDKWVELGGRIQLQYHYTDPDEGDSSDELFFRRLRPYIEGSIHEDWKGKFQFDIGKAEDDNELSVKDAYMEYDGFNNVDVLLGNAFVVPFSREQLTSSKRQQLVERTFVGDHNWGTPDRQLGLNVSGATANKMLTWGAGVSQAGLDPDNDKLDFASLANRDSDYNEGWMYGARVDYHPFGFLKKAQGDFARQLKATIGVSAFRWENDDDNNASGPEDVDEVTGFEVSGGLRAAGFSADAEYNLFDAETVQDLSGVSGIYDDGETDLEQWAVEGGYMVVPSKFEIVAGYQLQDADGYDEEWTRTSVGANYFFHKHDIKLQATYRMGENLDGVDGNDADEVFVQAQYVF